MPAIPTDVFALRNSGLEAFLHAEVGTEPNGSTLTVLSILARLGLDPWAEAAEWARLPKATVIDSLVQMMSQIPLRASALADSRAVAARLVLLLPSKNPIPKIPKIPGSGSAVNRLAVLWASPGALVIAILLCALALGAVLNLQLITAPPDGQPEPSMESVVP